MSKERNICPHCGAKQKISALVCDLCGSSLSGELVDAEENGHPFPDAMGDDTHDLDDEDGIFFRTELLKL